MNYYDLMYNFNNSDDWVYLNIDESLLPVGRYEFEEEAPVPVDQVLCRFREGYTVPSDYIMNDMIWLVVSEKARRIMEELNIGNCRFIDMVDERSGEVLGYLVQCMNYLDVFDEESATFGNSSTEERGPLIKHAIHGEKVGDLDIFKIKGEDFSVFVSERMKKAFEKNKCVGFSYMKIKS